MHNRAFSPDTTYNKSWFIVEKDLALPVDAALFEHIMARPARNPRPALCGAHS